MTDLTMFDNFEKIFCYQYPGVFNNLSLHPQVGEDAGIELYDKYKENNSSFKEKIPSLM